MKAYRRKSKMKENILTIAPLILGQVPQVSATELGQWLFCAACVLVILNYAMSFWKNITGGLKETPPPAQTYVQRTICKLLHIGIEKKISEQSERIEKAEEDTHSLRLEMKNDVKGIHDRINEVFKAVSRIEGILK